MHIAILDDEPEVCTAVRVYLMEMLEKYWAEKAVSFIRRNPCLRRSRTVHTISCCSISACRGSAAWRLRAASVA